MGRSVDSGAELPWTIAGLARLIERGELKPSELVAEVARPVEAGRGLGAFNAFDGAWMRKAAEAADLRQSKDGLRGPLDGIPLALKDNIDVAGIPTTAGTPALRDHVPTRNASVAERLLQAGALLGAKANMHELAGGGTTNSPMFGPARNPYDPLRIPGGSSGGSAVAVAARLIPAALGSDSAGSVRNPAHFCGIVGLKATLGRYPADGVVPLSRAVDTVGPMTLNVEDAVIIDSCLANDYAAVPPARLRGLRLGVPRIPFHENLSNDVERLFGEAVAGLEAEGVELVEAEVPDFKAGIEKLGWMSLGGQLKADLALYVQESGATVSVEEIAGQIADPFVKQWMEPFLNPTPELVAEYRALVESDWPAFKHSYAAFLEEHLLDAIIFPTAPIQAGVEVPASSDVILEGKLLKDGGLYNIQNTHPASILGTPGISLPMGMTVSSVPTGLEIDAGFGQDKRLLGIALAVEETLPRLPAP